MSRPFIKHSRRSMLSYGDKSANRILRTDGGGSLWQGGNPPTGYFLQDCGFDALVLCAEEIQPHESMFPGVHVIHAPNDDAYNRPIREAEWRIAISAAQHVTKMLLDHDDVLVACHQGINRSGLVCALTLHMLTRQSGKACVRHIRRRRNGALRNPVFVGALATLR